MWQKLEAYMSDRVTPLFSNEQPGPESEDITPSFVSTARAISAICATRMLLLIAVLTGAAIWGYTIIDPTRDRLFAAIAFSLVFVGPMVALYWRRA
jgi:hypothetical protein